MISGKSLEYRIWYVILKALNACYCHFGDISYCAVVNRPHSYGKSVKEDNQKKMKLAHTVDGSIFVGYQFSWFSSRVRTTNSSTHEMVIFCMNYEGKYSTNFEPLEWESFVKSTKIGTHENKAIHSKWVRKGIDKESIILYIHYHSQPLPFKTTTICRWDIYVGVFSTRDTYDVSGRFHGGIFIFAPYFPYQMCWRPECIHESVVASLWKSEERHLYHSAKGVWSCRCQWIEHLSLCPFQ